MRILLMEDEAAIRSALTRGLTARGHQVEAVACLADARALLARFSPEALVSDLKLPDGVGLDLAEELKVPFVLMTGYGIFDDAVRALRLGCLDFFTKPVSIKDINRALEQVAARTAAGPQVIAEDGGALRLARVRGGAVSEESLQHRTVQWSDPAQARQRFSELAPLLPSRTLTQITAELLQVAPRGQLAINLLPDRWAVWLQAPVVWDDQRDRVGLIQDLARTCVDPERGRWWSAPMADDPASDTPTVVRWSGDLLFPSDLAEAAIIDLSAVTVLGTWSYPWFRARPHLAVSAASPALRRQLLRANLPIAWADIPGGGVSPSERAALFGE